jgi:hypothetical protein
VQSPAPEFAIAGAVVQGSPVHVPVTVQTVFAHEAERVPVYPVEQTGAHVLPEAAPETQSPVFPLVIVGSPKQDVVIQFPVL